MSDLAGFVSDDELAAVLLRDRGWRVDSVPWDADVNWDGYDLAVIRTTWDYHERQAGFQEVLAEIERSAAALHNGLDLVHWNLDKRYLLDLAQAGVPTVPTVFADCLNGLDELAGHFLRFDSEEIVLKPVVNVNAFDTFRVPRAQYESYLTGLTAVFGNQPYLAQPFMTSICAEGEYSLIYFCGRFSHAICKKPKEGDFRVQEEYGGLITAVMPEPALLEAGHRALNYLDTAPLYARVDLVRDKEGAYLVMELELIEPSLYLRMDPGAPERFADALVAVGGSRFQKAG
jgi:hypothetical protein